MVTGPIDLQLEEDIGIGAEARRKSRRGRTGIHPRAAGRLGITGLAAVKCGRIAQAQARNRAAARFDAETFHHFDKLARLARLRRK